MMRGQVFEVAEDDNVTRSDIEHLLVLVDGEAEAAEVEVPVATSEDSSDEAWGDDLDVEELTKQLEELNMDDAKKFLSRSEWDVEGLDLALLAEQEGRDRSTIHDFIKGRIEDLKDEAEDADLLDE